MNKKIAGILLVFTLLGLYAFAQDAEEKRVKFDSGDWGVGFQIDGLIRDINISSFEDENTTPAFQVRKFLDDRWALRAEFGINVVSTEDSRVDSVDNFERTYDSTYNRTDWFIAPSVEYHFEGTRRLDPYAGAGLYLSKRGRETRNASTDLQDTIGTANITRNYDFAGGFQFGVNLMLGFNYFIAPKLALGGEYKMGFTRIASGGDFDVVTINTPITGAASTSRNRGSDRSEATHFATSGTVNISLSYYFNGKRRKTNSD